jgi:hypothetical protein
MPELVCYERYIFGISIAKDRWARLPKGADWTIVFFIARTNRCLKN